MKKRISLIAAAALLVMQACSFEEIKIETDTPQVDPYNVQIYAEITQQPATRVAVDDGFCAGDVVGVYLVNYEGENPGTLKLENNQADNVKFSFDENGNWTSEYDIYYKDNETNVDFYAYYPYAEPTSIEVYPFEVARDQSKGPEHGQLGAYEASDFLWAKKENVAPTASKVMLTFRHKMASARIRFSQGTGWNDAAEYAAVTKDVLVTNTIRKSTINLATGIVTPEGDVPLTGIVPMNDNGEYRAIVVPQIVEAGKTVLTLTIGGHPRHYVRDVDTEYHPGKMTTFDMTISKKSNTGEFEVELTGVNITAWEADNWSHGDDAREYVVVHNENAGHLERTIVDRLNMDPTKIRNLKITGRIGEEDYAFMRDRMTSLNRLNLKEVESVVNGVYSIPYRALYSKSTLTKCILPDKLERIERQAFESTSIIGKLLLPEGLKYVSGFGSTKINDILFPYTLEEIGDDAFEFCGNLGNVVFPLGLKSIGANAFDYSSISGELRLPDELTSLGECAFRGCKNLRGTLVIPKSLTSIPTYAFFSCGFTGNLILPETIMEIGQVAFASTSFRGELYLPESLVSIEHGAFQDTSFDGKLILPSGLVHLGSNAFSNCWRLNGTLELPQSILAISAGSFAGCGFESIILHKDIELIEGGAFFGCYYVNSITCEAKDPPLLMSDGFLGVPLDNFTLVVPEGSVQKYKNASEWNLFQRIEANKDFSINRGLIRSLNKSYSKTLVLRARPNDGWTVESKPDWIDVTPSEGVGRTEVMITTHEMPVGNGNRTGEIVFALNDGSYRVRVNTEQYDYQYGEGDLVTLQSSSIGNGVNVVIMGDCFDAKDISEGKYLSAITDAYGYFFDIEPYATYKDYFNVYGIFGVSEGSGVGTVQTYNEPRYGSKFVFSEGIAPDFDSIFSAACCAPINDDVSTTLIILILNSEEYAGICYMWGDGSAVAVVPMSTDPSPYDFQGILHHEAGGHGFGKLADEYIYHTAYINGCSCPCCAHVGNVEIQQSYGFYQNISLTSSFKDVPWAHLLYDPQYVDVVDVYEGAYFHSRNVYRSEANSCMNNNIPYFSAISREAMVKRIMKYAGEEYSFDEFKANDKESLPYVATKSDWLWSEESASSSRFEHMQPKFMGDKPSFKK